MDRIQEKLISFEKTVNHEVMKQKTELEGVIEKETADRLAEIRDSYQKTADEKFSINLTQIEKQVNGEIWADSVDAQKRILDKKNQIVGDVMDAVRARVNELINSDGYKDYLIASVGEAMSHVNGNATVYLTMQDKERFPEISAQVNNDIIGGCIVEDEAGMIIDNSIKTKIGQQRDLLNSKI